MSNVTPLGPHGVTAELLVNTLLERIKQGDEVYFIHCPKDSPPVFGMSGSPNGLRIAMVEFQRCGLAVLDGKLQVTGGPRSPA